MHYTYVTYPANGTVKIFAVTFPYLKKEHVHAYVNGVEDTGATWLTDTTMELSSTPSNGALVVLRRQTPYDKRSVDFTNDAVLDEITLDNAHNELFYVMQEVKEASDAVLSMDLNDSTWDMQGGRIIDAADPVDAQDVVTKAYLESQVQAVGDLAAIEQIKDDVEAIAADINATAVRDVDVVAPLTVDKTDPQNPVIGIDAEAVGGGGLEWVPTAVNVTAERNKGVMMDTSGSTKVVTPIASPEVGDSFGVADQKDTFHLNACTVDFTGILLHGVEQTEAMTLDVKGQKVVFAWVGGTVGWKIVELMPLGQAWEYMPYATMHVQDQKPNGSNAQTSAATTNNIRNLNTVVINDIVGASLSANQVTLPAGEYEIDVACSCGTDTLQANRVRLYDVTNSRYMEGLNNTRFANSTLRLKVALSSQIVFEVRHYSTTSGIMGLPLSLGTVEVYTDLKITKIGGNYAPKPVISSARLQPMAGVVPNCQVQGFEITNTGANQLTVTKGQCLDSTLTIPVAVTGNTVLTLDTTANKLFTIAAVILNNGTHTCKAYDSEAAMAADVGVNVTHVAYIGWWQNNGSGVAKAGRLFGAGDGLAELWWSKASENAVNSKVSLPANCDTAVPLASFLPSSDRVIGVLLGIQSASSGATAVFGVDGTSTSQVVTGSSTNTADNDAYAWSHPQSDRQFLPIKNNTVYWGDGSVSTSGTHDIRLHATRFRR